MNDFLMWPEKALPLKPGMTLPEIAAHKASNELVMVQVIETDGEHFKIRQVQTLYAYPDFFRPSGLNANVRLARKEERHSGILAATAHLDQDVLTAAKQLSLAKHSQQEIWRMVHNFVLTTTDA